MHEWKVSEAEAIEIQNKLRSQVILEDSFALDKIKTVAGLDAAYQGDNGKAAALLFAYPAITLLEEVVTNAQSVFPYIPGLLSFRETPLALEALAKLKTAPDLVIVDGYGYAHPRRLGFGSHLGLWLDKPVIGVAKTRFIGTYSEPGNQAGDFTPLLDNGEEIGAVLRTQPNVKPIYVSCGHKISLPTAIKIVMGCVRGFRLPEPTRQADIVVAR
jgi:deoxyribonuclease V